jgi:hypothetical protein
MNALGVGGHRNLSSGGDERLPGDEQLPYGGTEAWMCGRAGTVLRVRWLYAATESCAQISLYVVGSRPSRAVPACRALTGTDHRTGQPEPMTSEQLERLF